MRQKIGRGEETVDPPANVRTVGQLAAWLATRGEGYAQALGDLKRIRVAINHDHSDFGAPLEAEDEIAFFPPVTGG